MGTLSNWLFLGRVRTTLFNVTRTVLVKFAVLYQPVFPVSAILPCTENILKMMHERIWISEATKPSMNRDNPLQDFLVYKPAAV